MIPRELAEEWLRRNPQYEDLRDINTGGCERFAAHFQPHVPNGELTGTDNFVCWRHTQHWPGGHVWIFDGHKHYDSEALEGVDEWEDLPFFTRSLPGLVRYNCGCPQVSFKSP